MSSITVCHHYSTRRRQRVRHHDISIVALCYKARSTIQSQPYVVVFYCLCQLSALVVSGHLACLYILYIYMYLLTSKSAVDQYKQDGIPVEYAKVGALLSYVNVVIL